jgi:IS5 family transposase
VKGNPKDSKLYEGTVEEIKKAYGKTPESSVTDGGYASKANLQYAKEEGDSKHSV